MPSSSRPYKSRLLRLVLSQFQQGMERQRQVWRRAKSAVIWGAQATLYPVYVLLRTVKTTDPQISSAGDARFSPRRLLNWFQNQSGPSTSRPSTADLVPTAASSSEALVAADQPIVQALTMVRQWQLPAEAGPLVRQLRGWLRRTEPMAIQGIASDLELRSLQLIGPDNQVALPLSPTHQAYLQRQIQVWIEAYWQQATQIPCLEQASAVLPLPDKKKQRLFSWRAAVSGALQPHSSDHLSTKVTADNAISGEVPPEVQSVTAQRITPLPPRASVASLPVATAWEASVIESTYIPHPLEQLLRWIDQLLTWLEQRWVPLWQRLRCTASDQQV